MLAEALLYARARLGGQGNPYGHLAESVGIWARHRRHRQAWAPHLTRARSLCLRAAEALPENRRRTALVLGAGVLLDVPLEALSRLFRSVVLADLAFLPQTVRLARRLGNVELVTADLSGSLESLAHGGEAASALPDLSLGLPELDFVYSANLASQLPLSALGLLRRHRPQAAPEELERAAAGLVRAHFEALSQLSCPVCLVTDTVEQGFEAGRPEYEADLLFGVAPGGTVCLEGECWVWEMAPQGEIQPGLDVRRLVFGVADFRARRGGDGDG